MRYLLLCVLATAPLSFAWDMFSSEESQDYMQKAELVIPERDQTPPPCLSPKERKAQNMYTCPRVEELYKSNLRWKTDTGWQGYQDSFAENLLHFMGAQWKGVGLGRIFCLYQSDSENDFPVQIAHTALIVRPDTAKWENNPQKDLINCISSNANPCDCQFSLYRTEEETDVDKIISSIEKK